LLTWPPLLPSPQRPPLSPVFFFHRHRPPPPLHSFPTRRSSDLYTLQSVTSLVEARAPMWRCAAPTAPRSGSSRRWASAWSSRGRSEEHTSELQSLRHLVCRLLLEKKKNYDACYARTLHRLTSSS